MDNLDLEFIRRDMSTTIYQIFEEFEDMNNCLPTMEEFRILFDIYSANFIPQIDETLDVQVKELLAKYEMMEQQVWKVFYELESEERKRRI
ncbi:hypothetical protein UA32_05235 [Photobacterium angustum]|uniref:Uncharacterized protein n=2 Tax=Photobacterium angustum TaxID=661 RepID=A0ABX5H5Z6_PHOAN|nr:hypothetical protein UA32_05235 [Photobacterium angustum]PSX11311.1 hypothetical protein C0W27_06240 [Photobacterium angustum]